MHASMESVCLNVSLIAHVEAIFIAQIIKSRMIGIMACTYCVEIVHFHEDDVFNHGFFRYGLPPLWTMFMTIHALNNDRDTIYPQPSVMNINNAHSHSARFNVRPHVQNTTRLVAALATR
mmetsp:Transcript_9508/g.38879  ORF Transcript_9508/g.38879 Transcript_9508/m.38879 type:complete len:120 (+) Transcript_9508:3692-4051(+)